MRRRTSAIKQPIENLGWFGDDGIIAVMRRLFDDGFRGQHRGPFVLAMGCMLVVSATTAMSAWIISDVVNRLFISRDMSLVVPVALAIGAMFIVRGFAAYGREIILGRIGTAITRQFQVRMIRKLTTLSFPVLDASRSGNVIMRISRNGNVMADAVILVAAHLGGNLLTVLALAVVMVMQDPLMSAIIIVFVPFVVLGMRRLTQQLRQQDTDEFSGMSAVVGATSEAISGMSVVRVFGLEESVNAAVEAAARGTELRRNSILQITALTLPLVETLAGIAVSLVIIYAGWQSVGSGRTPGEFMSFLTAFLLAYEPAKRLAGINIQLQRSANRAKMVYEMLDSPQVEADRPGALDMPRPVGAITFEDVGFSYDGVGLPVLDGLSFDVRPGSITAIVGVSGAGKSTVFKLLQRLYEPTAGRILIDGTDIASVTRASLRANMATVLQDTFLFAGTIRENIAHGRPGASDAEIEAAAEAALVTEFSSRLKRGLDARVGENGRRFSGGQRQRIAIARALLRDAQILLLDEATASLDNQSERIVRAAIDRLTLGRTTLLVSHRLSSIASADRVLVIDGGKIVEQGRHDDLLALNGTYARFFATGGLDDRAATAEAD